jgi:hypothetical protein
MQYTVFAAQSGVRAAYVDEDGECRYAPIIGWILDELEGQRLFRAIVHDGEIPTEATILEDSQCLARLVFNGENLNGSEIDHYTKRVREEQRRESEFDEKSRAMRKQIGAALLAAHPAALSKAELLAGGVADIDGMLLPLLGLLKNNRLINEGHSGMFTLTERGLAQAKASTEKAA